MEGMWIREIKGTKIKVRNMMIIKLIVAIAEQGLG
jgi:hypothetical protein